MIPNEPGKNGNNDSNEGNSESENDTEEKPDRDVIAPDLDYVQESYQPPSKRNKDNSEEDDSE